MNILALDTTTAACSVALLKDTHCVEQFELAPKRHTERVLPLCEAVLREAQISLSDIDVFAVTRGPGSFTGVRLGISLIQGISLGQDKPVVTVSTLAAIAQGAFRQYGIEQALVCLDARMQEIYWAQYQVGASGLVELVNGEQLSSPNLLNADDCPRWTGVGYGWEAYQHELSEQRANMLNCITDIYPRAQDVATLAKREFSLGHVLSAAQVLPSYLRDQVA